MKRLFLISVLLVVLFSAGFPQDTVHVKSGWNLIGSVKAGAFPDVLTTDPPDIITTQFFGYNPGIGYETADTLTKGVGYWVKVSSNGVIIFNTPTSQDCGRKLVIYGNKIYHTVQIGDQCWFDENLNVGIEIAGMETQTDNDTIEKYCYDDDPSNCLLYGGLYQWDEAMQYATVVGARGICPEGWHLATYSEIQALSSSVYGDGNALKAVGQGAGEGSGTNTSGFSSMPAGGRYPDGSFNELGNYAHFWSSTENGAPGAWGLGLSSFDSYISLYGSYYKSDGFSVRCIED